VPFVVNAVKPTHSPTSKVFLTGVPKKDYHFDVATNSKHAALGKLIMQVKIAIGGEESAALSHPPPRAGKRCLARRTPVLRNGGPPPQSPGEQLRALCNQVGSDYPRRENFRLTPKVKAKFTERLGSDPKGFSGRKALSVVCTMDESGCSMTAPGLVIASLEPGWSGASIPRCAASRISRS
jgi:hypothetical protein